MFSSQFPIYIAIIAAALILGIIVYSVTTKAFVKDDFNRQKKKKPQKAKKKNTLLQNEKFDKFTGVVQRLVPESQSAADATRVSLMKSGLKISTAKLWSMRVVCLAVGLIVGLYAALLVQGIVQAILVVIVFLVAGVMAPQLYVLNKRKEWRNSIKVQLPDAIDLLCMTVSAGATFDAGLRSVAERMSGVFPDACNDVLDQSRYTRTIDAMEQFADNAQVQSLTNMVSAVKLAQELGTPIAVPLQEQAKLAREMRRLELEKKAQELDSKMILPMGVFAFPAYIGLLLGPFFMQAIEQLTTM